MSSSDGGLLDASLDRASRFGVDLSAVCLVLMMAIGTADVLGIAFFSVAVPSATEASEVLLAMAVFLPLMHVQRKHKHIAVDQLVQLFPFPARWAAEAFALLAGLVVLGVIAWQALVLAAASWSVREYANALITFPIYPVKAIVALGAAAATVEYVRQLALHFIRAKSQGISSNPEG